MGSPYGTVTEARILPPGWRCTAYYFATRRGLPITFGYLLELGARAARAARSYGIAQAMTREGPYLVHQWPPEIFEEAADSMNADWQASQPPPAPYARPDSPHPMVHDVLALQARYGDDGGHGYHEAGDYG